MLPPVLRKLQKLGHTVFATGAYNVNLVAVRSANPVADSFDDLLLVIYREPAGNWVCYGYPCTADPGLYWLENPGKVAGTAILAEGQHRSAFKLGTHKGQYKCLVQRKAVRVWRDANRDKVLDWPANDPGTPGWYGIQVHRASAHGPVDDVGRWSAGCVVVQHPDHFTELMAICHKAAAEWGDSFTLTVVREDQL
jgi:hypothetical protein